jgi:hypothetical protein
MREHVPSGRLALVMGLAGGGIVAIAALWLFRLPRNLPWSWHDASLAFVACGAGLLSALWGRRRLTVAFALLVGLMAAGDAVRASLQTHGPYCSWVSSIPNSILQPITPRLSLCLVLTVIGLALMSSGRRLRHRSYILGVVGSAIGGIGLAAVLDDLLQDPSAGVLRALGHAVEHPGLLLMLFGLGVLSYAWQDGSPAQSGGPRWLPISIAIVVVSLTLALWEVQRAREHRQIGTALENEAQRVRAHVFEQVGTRVFSLIRIARRWETQGRPSKKLWESEAQMAIDPSRGYQEVDWIDPSNRIRWSVGVKGSPEAGADAGRDPVQGGLLRSVRDRRQGIYSRTVPLPGGNAGFYTYFPISVGNRFEGTLRGVLSYKRLFDSVLQEQSAHGYLVAIFDGPTPVYGPRPPEDAQLVSEADLRLLNLPWRLKLWANEKRSAEMDSALEQVVLIAGLLTALLLLHTVRLAQQARWRAQQLDAANRDLKQEIEEHGCTEQRLQQGNAYLNALVSSSPLAIVGLDPEGRVTLANPAFERIFGYEAANIVGKRLDDFIASPRFVEEACEFTARVTRGESIHATTRRARADGTETDVELFGVPLVMDGQAFSAYVLYQDISERKRGEEALAHERDLLQALMDNMPDRIYFKDAQSRFTRINLAHARSLGLASPDEAIGKSDFDVSPRERAQQYFADEQEILRSGQPLIGKIQKYERPGGVRYSSVTKVPMLDKDGRPAGIAGISRDVTDWIQAEEALRESETRYRVLFDNSPYPMFVCDQETLAYLAVNEAAVRQYGYSAEEFATMTAADLRPEEEMPRLRERLAASNLESLLTRHRKKDGTLIDVETNAREVTFGGRRAYMVLAADVTEKRQLEERLRQSQKMEAVGRLAGGVAHDFNNLLTVIIGYSDLLRERLGSNDGLCRAAEEIHKAAERGASLTHQLLAFSRRQVLQPKVLHLNSVVADIEKLLRRLIGEDVELVTALDPSLGLVKADPGQIEQVVLNLAVNARDAMPNGGRLTIESKNADLDETYSTGHYSVQPGRYVMLAVSDSGCGMGSEVMAHLFEPFYTTKELGKGTGLGLATVYGILKQSGGYIWVYSEPGQGTTFKVYLPRIDQPAGSVQPAVPAGGRELQQGTETVLLVEDEAMVRQLVQEVLQRNGYSVMAARDGDEAMKLSSEHAGPIHLLLTDVVMSGMSGRELVQRLSRLRPETSVLFMSGYTDDSIVKQGILEAGAAFLQKPFSAQLLTRTVRQVLDVGVEGGGGAAVEIQ